jgi:hypothetical protein
LGFFDSSILRFFDFCLDDGQEIEGGDGQTQLRFFNSSIFRYLSGLGLRLGCKKSSSQERWDTGHESFFQAVHRRVKMSSYLTSLLINRVQYLNCYLKSEDWKTHTHTHTHTLCHSGLSNTSRSIC